MKSSVAVVGVVLMGLSLPVSVGAQECPPEVKQAKSKISSAQAAVKKAQSKEIEAPRTEAGFRKEQQVARGQEQQLPRGQEQQLPRGQEQQLPRGQEQQLPRGQEQQLPRGQEQQLPRGQEQNLPRGQEQQLPRGQEQNLPRGQEQQLPRSPAGAKTQAPSQSDLKRASGLLAEAEKACKAGDMTLASQKAKAAMAAVK